MRETTKRATEMTTDEYHHARKEAIDPHRPTPITLEVLARRIREMDQAEMTVFTNRFNIFLTMPSS